LNALSILAAAEITGAEAIHPGYGFLAENADFAQMVIEHGFTFIGPSPEHLRIMGDKILAKKTAAELGLPVVPGTEEAIGSEAEALAAAERIGFPLLIKAAAGGGGRGMTVVQNRSQLEEGLRLARREAKLGFGDDRVYLERYLDRPRHIEIQVLGDQHGNLVHLGERDCTLQRRHQKVVEEAPSPVLSAEERAEIGARVTKALAKLGYANAGTVEFLWQDGQFYFIEMNTRLQVEHPVTELVTGVDIVREQIRIAAGERLRLRQDRVRIQGHAIEVRVTAEDPRTLTPAPGKVSAYHPPGGPGVRVDSALYAGYTVPPHYDSLIAKLIVHDVDRAQAIRRLERALAEYVIDGMATNLPLLRALFATEEVRSGQYDTRWLGQFLQGWRG
jgi:acetyl-CoA carboxylase biotin carboxylase subunit